MSQTHRVHCELLLHKLFVMVCLPARSSRNQCCALPDCLSPVVKFSQFLESKRVQQT
ncbi:hypothetical protein M758_8G083000 [Ceratodon purpureus]|nr:hypothetical protein M758_8G083000 [Ceratodon purpureus]